MWVGWKDGAGVVVAREMGRSRFTVLTLELQRHAAAGETGKDLRDVGVARPRETNRSEAPLEDALASGLSRISDANRSSDASNVVAGAGSFRGRFPSRPQREPMCDVDVSGVADGGPPAEGVGSDLRHKGTRRASPTTFSA